MKILKLKFKNLNSLYGEWSIDFIDAAYEQNGIFALTGPTGAGKTTILDAICLALYGRTARLDKITKSVNDIMSRQTAECFAEVEFSSQMGQFLCRWSQHRARHKADGSLQDTHQEIAALENGQWKILATKKKEFDALVEENTGMDFDRFLRAMLLAQGKFDSFLKADTNTKSAVLEKITGTKIYSEISQRVHRRSVEEENALKILRAQTEGILLLSEQTLKDIGEQLHQHRQEEVQLHTQLKQLGSEIQWHRHLIQMRSEVKQLEQQLEHLNDQQTQFIPQRNRLGLALKAQELSAVYASLKTLREEQNRAREQQHTLQIQLPELQQSLEQNLRSVKAQEQQWLMLKKEWEGQQELWKQVRAMDVQIRAQQDYMQMTQKSLEEISQQQQVLQQQQLVQQQQIDSYQQQLLSSEQYLQAHSQDKVLVEKLSGWQMIFAQIQKETEQVESVIQQQAKRQADFIKIQEQLQQLDKELMDLSQQAQTLVALQQVQQQALNETLQSQTVEYYQRELEHAREKKALIQNIHDVAEIRAHLVEHEPCPVCGSIEHPYREGIPPLNTFDEEITALHTRLAKIQTIEVGLRELSSQIQRQYNAMELKKNDIAYKRQQVTEVQRVIEEEQARQGTLEEKLKTSEQQLLLELSVFQVEQLNAQTFLQLNHRVRQWHAYTDMYQQATEHIKPLQEKKAGLVAEQSMLKSNLDTLNHKLNEQQVAVDALLANRQALFGQQDVKEVENRLKESVDASEQRYKSIEQAYHQAKSVLERTQVRLNQLSENMSHRQQELTSAENDFAQGLQMQQFSDEVAFLQAVLSREQLQRLQAEAQSLDSRQTELKALIQESTSRLVGEENKQLSITPLEQLEHQYQQLEPQLRWHTDQAAALEERLRQDKQSRAHVADKQALILQQEQEVARWKNLRSLIGSSDGSTYRNFVQGLTFELMISHANQQLRKMSDRYVLLHDRENVLSLNVLDAYQAGEVRSVRNLSGGESFIISLALALGLSKMSSQKIRVDSLFLDEGFGTLDEEILETALDTLSALHEDNKLIGVISHMSALKNRISTQIQVEPLQGGRSVLKGPGVSRG